MTGGTVGESAFPALGPGHGVLIADGHLAEPGGAHFCSVVGLERAVPEGLIVVAHLELAAEQAPQVEATALQVLRQFLHPLTGGYLNRGWEFGRLPCLSDFYTLLEDIDGVDHVDNLMMTLRAVTPTGVTIGEPQQVTEEQPLMVTMPEHTLIYGEAHTITVKA